MHKEKKFFASANTDKGFVSYFDDIYGNLDYVYIIKGGPGTGKSSFIRSISDEAEKQGFSVEYFYCSSDPLSLDGIIIEGLKIAVIDGTAPHTYDPKYPGIKDRIINLGKNWDIGKLNEYYYDVCKLIEEKNNLYVNVYNYLAAIGRIEAEIRYCNRRLINIEKMENAVKRLTKGWKSGKAFSKTIRPIEGISHAGHIIYDTYELCADNKYVIRDRYGIGGVYLEMLLKVSEQKGLHCLYSPSVIDQSTCTALFLPEVKSSFIIKEDDSYDKKTINMDRFIDLDSYKKNKQKNRFARRCLNSLYEGVQRGFDEIYDLHSSLEKCYIEAMDFSKNQALAEQVKREIF